jgi:hypothetical protein
MNSLPRNTIRRLQKIPQIPHVWEGDRRPLAGMMSNLEPELQEQGECIIWVDSSEGFVRAMEVVRANTGPEAMVRTLLQAIETPHSPAEPARPQKIVVCDRELQFFLRGALQNLGIAVDYVPNLLLIDELWRNFEDISEKSVKNISTELEKLLEEAALEIWDLEPWQLLTDHDILKIDLNRWDIDSIYACVMGMLGQEYGIIFYRSLDSLKKFRTRALTADEEDLDEELEAAFLQQDCWFINFVSKDEDDYDLEYEDEVDIGELFSSDIQPLFGSIHPFEGMRPLRDEEEVLPIYVALQALTNFVEECEEDLMEEVIGDVSRHYDLTLPTQEDSISVNVSTLPELTAELMEILEEAEAEEEEKLAKATFFLKDDLIPPGSIISFTIIGWKFLEDLRGKRGMYVSSVSPNLKELWANKTGGLPVILVQTTRPKAKILMARLQQEGGLTGISFNPGSDPFEEISYDLGILQTPQNNLYLFAQFAKDESSLYQAVRQWQKKAKKIEGYCALLVAMGVTGASRNNPQLKDIMGLFETTLINSKDLGIGTLTLELERKG